MKKILVLTLFVAAAGFGCEYTTISPERLEEMTVREETETKAEATPDVAVSDTGDIIVPESPASDEPADDSGSSGMTQCTPYLVCEDCETNTNCYWADPVPPPSGLDDAVVVDGVLVNDTPEAEDPVLPPAEVADPVVIGPVNGFDHAQPIHPDVIVDPVFPRQEVVRGETATF